MSTCNDVKLVECVFDIIPTNAKRVITDSASSSESVIPALKKENTTVELPEVVDTTTAITKALPPFYVKPSELNYGKEEETHTPVTNNKGAVFPYAKIPMLPVEEFEDGIRIDFNSGCRVYVPKESTQKYRISILDDDKNLCLYAANIEAGMCAGIAKKFFIKYRVEVYRENEVSPFINYTLDLNNKLVMIQCNGGGLGDSIAWFSNVDAFIKKHNCRALVTLEKYIIPIFKNQYPHIRFIPKEESTAYLPFATYYMGLFFSDDKDFQPMDFRLTGLHKISAYILGVDKAPQAPLVDLKMPRKIKEKYVVISTQSTTQCKYWNNPYGWHEVIKFLKDNGYRVLCIDRDAISVIGNKANYIPHGCEDFTGNVPLQKRIDIIKDADFFVGLSSGLSWLAWCCNVPVVLISGFTEDYNEFDTPYRVINPLVCHGCWNDLKEEFDHSDFMYCPKQKGTDSEFICTRAISHEQVINTIKKVPTFRGNN